MLSPNFFLLHLERQLYFGEQWLHSGESIRLPPMWPRFDSQTRCHMWVEFVGSLLCSERFSPEYSGFPIFSKTCIWFNLIYINFNLQCPQLVCLNAKLPWHLNKVSFLSFPFLLEKQLTVAWFQCYLFFRQRHGCKNFNRSRWISSILSDLPYSKKTTAQGLDIRFSKGL